MGASGRHHEVTRGVGFAMNAHSSVRSPRARYRRGLVTIFLVAAAVHLSGCAHGRQLGSYRPIGASSWYGDSTEDGLAVLLRMSGEDAIQAVERVLRVQGYSPTSASGSPLLVRTDPRSLGADTTLVVTAQVLPVDLPEPGASVVLQATYSVPSRRLRNAPVLQRPGETSPLYEKLKMIARALRESRGRAP